jgi:hypothetical protein
MVSSFGVRDRGDAVVDREVRPPVLGQAAVVADRQGQGGGSRADSLRVAFHAKSAQDDIEALDQSAKLVAQLKQLALDSLQAFEFGEELEGGFASEPSRVTRAKHGHRAPKAGDLAGPGAPLHVASVANTCSSP